MLDYNTILWCPNTNRHEGKKVQRTHRQMRQIEKNRKKIRADTDSKFMFYSDSCCVRPNNINVVLFGCRSSPVMDTFMNHHKKKEPHMNGRCETKAATKMLAILYELMLPSTDKHTNTDIHAVALDIKTVVIYTRQFPLRHSITNRISFGLEYNVDDRRIMFATKYTLKPQANHKRTHTLASKRIHHFSY